MNSFQRQFNSLLGVVLGAKKLGTPSAPTPSAPTASTTFSEDTELEYSPFGLGMNYQTSTATVDPETQKRMEAKARSMKNLYNRHESLRAVKNARVKEKIVEVEKSKPTSDTPLGSIKSHNLGGKL